MSELNPPKVSQGEIHAEQAYKSHSAEWDELIAERESEYQQQYTQGVYDENRPYQDANGATHSPVDSKFINPDKYFDEQRDIHAGFDKMEADKDYDEYQEMGLKELSERYAEAEYHNDKTSSWNISEVIDQKVDAQAYKNDSPQVGDDIRENLYNMVLKNAAKHQDKLKSEAERSSTRDRIDPENAASVMHTMKNVGIPEDIIKNIPKENFYHQGDPEKSSKVPEELKDWISDNRDADENSKNPSAQEEEEPADNRSDAEKAIDELNATKARLLENEKELARLDAENARSGDIGNKARSASWKSRVAFWKRKSQQDPNNTKDNSDRNKKYVKVAIGAIATIAAGYALSKGMNLGGGNKSLLGAESAASVNPFKGLDIKDMLELATNKATQAAEATEATQLAEYTEKAKDAHEAWKGTVSSGEGPTYVIQDMLEAKGINLSPEQLHDVYSQNESFFSNLDNAYSLPNGDVGFRNAGSIQIPYDVMEQMIRDAKELTDK